MAPADIRQFMHEANLKILLASPGGWHLPNTANALQVRNALAGLWISNKNASAVESQYFRSNWPFHILLKPLFHLAPQIVQEKAFYSLLPVWKSWIKAQNYPECSVVQGIMGFCTELFDKAEELGALKVVDCTNSHPTTYHGYWQRECDLWCPGEKVPIPWWMFSRMNRELERADLILCPSDFVRDTMLLNGIPKQKCFVNPFGVNTEIFRKREGPPSTPRFISVGTICLRKGFHYLMRAFELVKTEWPDAELIVVGDYKSDFRKERPKWEGKFTHFKRLPHSELSELLQTCTAFVFPSMEEGFARVIPEAMGAGLPIIASYESGAATLVNDGVEGYIVRGRDPDHIAEVMIRVTKDREMNQGMGAAAYTKGAACNSWQDYGDRLLSKYSELVAR
jgi:glycosyltransferase involved in cell wall biosynthesis